MHPLTAWLALVGSVWALFALADEHLPPPYRAQVSHWLRGQTAHWPVTFIAVYDSVFSPPDRAGAARFRAGVASQVAVFLALCVSGVLYPGTSGPMVLALVLHSPGLMGSLALVHLLPGCLALRLHRVLLHPLKARPTPGRLGVWLVSASVAMLALGLLGWALGLLVVLLGSRTALLRSPVTWIVGYVEFVLSSPGGLRSALHDALLLQPLIVPGVAFPSFGIWVYAPCFPFVWVSLYVLSGTLLRRATAWGLLPGPEHTPRRLDVDTRPLHALGAVAVAVVSAVYWAAVLWWR